MKTHIFIPKLVKIELTLVFDEPSDAGELLNELRTWQPSQGWSTEATDLFEALEKIANVRFEID